MPAPTAPVELVRKELPLPSYVDNVVLAGAAKTITFPAGVSWVRISVTALSYIRVGSTAIVPAADTGSGGGAPALGEGSFPIHPGQDGFFYLKGNLSFSIISPAAVVAVAYYRDHSDA